MGHEAESRPVCGESRAVRCRALTLRAGRAPRPRQPPPIGWRPWPPIPSLAATRRVLSPDTGRSTPGIGGPSTGASTSSSPRQVCASPRRWRTRSRASGWTRWSARPATRRGCGGLRPRSAGSAAVRRPPLRGDGPRRMGGRRTGRTATKGPRDPPQLGRTERALAGPGGESPDDVAARVVPAIDELAAIHRGGQILIVAHMWVVRSAVCHALGIPMERSPVIGLQPGGLTALRWPTDGGSGRPRLLELGATAVAP